LKLCFLLDGRRRERKKKKGEREREMTGREGS
jgi:hypothetical protein